jgi:hypothetical protein
MGRWFSANKWKVFAVTLTGIGLACAEMHGRVSAIAANVWQEAEDGLKREAETKEP